MPSGTGPHAVRILTIVVGALALLVVALRPADAAEDAPPGSMDANGRVEKPTLPSGLANADRWRYTPDEMMRPGTLLQRELISAFIVPDVEYERDVGLTVGVAAADYDFRDQRRREYAQFYASHSTLGQEDYEVLWRRYLHSIELPGQGDLINERGTVSAWSGYQKTLTARFYGFGPETSEFAETSYTLEEGWVEMAWEDAIPHPGDDLLLGAGMTLEHVNVGSGHVHGIPSTTTVYPELLARAEDVTEAWVHAHLRYDTRDSLDNPYRGGYAGITEDALVASHLGRPGGITTVRGGWVHALPGLFHSGSGAGEEDPPTDVLAVDGFVRSTSGPMAFYNVPTLGGGRTLRGYIANRWSGRESWHASLEYRVCLLPRGVHLGRHVGVERVSLVPFADIGTVADRISALSKAVPKTSVGMGLRIALDRISIVRVDLAESREGLEFLIGYGQPF